jgi:hypothetical protein
METTNIKLHFYIYRSIEITAPTLVAAQSMAWACGPMLAGIAGSNPAEAWMSVSWKCCVLSGRDLRNESVARPEDIYTFFLQDNPETYVENLMFNAKARHLRTTQLTSPLSYKRPAEPDDIQCATRA